jgi:MFS-type transporter involved in bile tolerance (Atg22 family)
MNVRAPMNVRAIVAWTLYDFANSSLAAVIFATIYAAYYARRSRRPAG